MIPHQEFSLLAYLDPFSGSVLIQVILAGAAAAVVFFKVQGRRIKAFFGSKDGEETDDA